MKYIKTDIEGVWVIEPKVFNDARGYFFESFKQREFDEHIGHHVEFIQDNESKSGYGVLRGLHYQQGEFSQAKLVRVIKGKVVDVAVDIRKSSPTFGKYVMVELSEDNKRQFFIPAVSPMASWSSPMRRYSPTRSTTPMLLSPRQASAGTMRR